MRVWSRSSGGSCTLMVASPSASGSCNSSMTELHVSPTSQTPLPQAPARAKPITLDARVAQSTSLMFPLVSAGFPLRSASWSTMAKAVHDGSTPASNGNRIGIVTATPYGDIV